jgi:hypothetical protein
MALLRRDLQVYGATNYGVHPGNSFTRGLRD